MSTFDEYIPELFVSFKEDKTQRVIFNSKSETRIAVGGQYGESPQVKVLQNGKPKWLTIRSKGLWEQLEKFKGKGSVTLDITQSGSGTGTKYEVKKV